VDNRGNPPVVVICKQALEFDDHLTYERFKEVAQAASLADLVHRIESGYLGQSPSGGIHWFYRCSEISGNTKLAPPQAARGDG
jgi:hypothetical protein